MMSEPLLGSIQGERKESKWGRPEYEGEEMRVAITSEFFDEIRNRRSAHVAFPPMIERPSPWVVLFVVVIGILFALAATVWKDDLENIGVTTNDIIRYGSIPFVSTIFTYFHIWLALWMTFYPTEYFGYCQIKGTNTGLGWQGIIPSKAEKMARTSVQLMTQRLINVKEVFSRLDPTRMADELEPIVYSVLEDIIDSVATEHVPGIWTSLPPNIKKEIVDQAHEDSPTVVKNLMLEMRENIDQVFDLENMVVDSLTRDKALLNNIFIQCGYKELAFIRNSGAYMGGIFGVFQMILWIFYDSTWTLPVIGLFVGALTNWIALKIIFSPVDPVDLGCYNCQGLFLKRQVEVAGEYSKVVSRFILSAQNIIAWIISGPATDRLINMSQTHIQEACDKFTGIPDSVINLTIGQSKFSTIKQQICDRFIVSLPNCMAQDDLARIEKYTEEALGMEPLLKEKMTALSPHDFERLLHPVFEEDEWKLILLGGVLGVVVGIAQAYGLQQ